MAPSASGPVWVTARVQTAGRGRRGRAWTSPPGNLAASLLLFPEEPAAVAALRSFVAALALADAFDAVGIDPSAVALKWPNDVLLAGGKAAGILLEAAGQGRGLGHLVIGIGVNLVAAPPVSAVEPGAVPPVAVADLLGHAPDPDDMLTALAAAYAAREAAFRAEGFAPIRSAWMARAARLGDRIVARTPRETLTGMFETIDFDGNLVLKTSTGVRTIAAAEVFF